MKASSKPLDQLKKPQKQIIQWLKKLPQHELKKILTIKNPQNTKILQSFMFPQKKKTPSQIIKGGYTLIVEKYRHKIYTDKVKSARVNELAQKLYQNLTVKRIYPFSVSIRKTFFLDMYSCLDELSKNQTFMFYLIKYIYLKQGQKKYNSLWFDTNHIHSLAQWLVYFFQCQVRDAWNDSKQLLKQEQNLSQYIKQIYQQNEQRLKKLLQKIITKYFVQGNPKETNYQNEKNFYLNKCMDRINQNKILGIQQYLLQYSWLNDDPNNIYNQIFSKLVQVLQDQYGDWRNKKMGQPKQKKKKKKNKKNTKKVEQKSQKQQSQKDQQQQQFKKQSKKQQQLLKKQQQQQQIRQQKQCDINLEKELKYDNIQIITKEQEDQKFEQKICEQFNNKSLLQEEYFEQKQQVIKITNSLFKPFKNKKTVKLRINQYLKAYTQGIKQQANTYEKYRKIIFKIIQQFFTQQLKLKNEWKLCLYGSCAAGFALKQSDIDLVILADTNEISLKVINQWIKLKQWAINCKLIQSSVPIIKFEMNLNYCHLALEKLNQKKLKKIDGYLFQVDLTLSNINQKHTGIQNTIYLKHILQNNGNIWNTCLIFKQLLKCKKMNKPFQGGISSYVLVMMIYNILKIKNLHNQTDYYRQIVQVCQYIGNKFIPFKTVISSRKEGYVKLDQNVHLNVQDPTTKNLLKTSAFKIQKIQQQLSQFGNILFQIQKSLLEMQINEKKKMKKFFMDKLYQYFHKQNQEV